MKIAAFALFLAFVHSAHAESGQVASEQIVSVAKSKTWLRLLHFDQKSGHSEIVNPDFFYSPMGATRPDLELAANIEQIKNETETTEEAKRYSCRFPARQRFIEERFGIVARTKCPSFEAFRAQAEPDSITFVYASQYVGNPASAFGHSFLRIDHATHSKLLGYALTYFAKTGPNDKGFAYAYKGLFGGFTGHYEFDRYYPKTHMYSSAENRDMWEYSLKLTTEERRRIFEHARELAIAGQKKYFFLDRNCTFQLLRLLEVANENLDLTTRGDAFFLTPQDTVKILADANLMGDSSLRPSLRQKAQAYYSALDDQHKELLHEVLNKTLEPEKIQDPMTASALVATLAIGESKGDSTPAQSQMFSRMTKVRSQLPMVASPYSQIENGNGNPLGGHDTLQANVGAVRTESGSALQLGFRPAMHALNDYAVGFLSNTQLVFMDTSVRIENEQSQAKIRLQELTFLDIKSLPSYSIINDQFSWTTQLALKPVLASDCEKCLQLRSSVLLGYSADIVPRFLGYALAGPTLDAYQPEDAITLRAGPSVVAGVLSRNIDHFVLKLEGRLDNYLMGPNGQESLFLTDLSVTWLAAKNSHFSVNSLQTQNLRRKDLHDDELAFRFSQNF